MDFDVQQLLSQAHCLADMFEEEGERGDIDEAIDLDRQALELCPPGHSMRSRSLNALASHLWDRYDRLGAMMDIEEAIVLCREVLALRPPVHPGHPSTLVDLAAVLAIRFKQLGAVEDIHESIILNQDALVLLPPGHPERHHPLRNLAFGLQERYRYLGAVEDLNESIALNRDALALCPPGHSHCWYSLNNLGFALHERYNQLGAIQDVDEAIVLHRDALVHCQLERVHRPHTLSNLADDLHSRYKYLGAVEDLDEAIMLDRQALLLRPPDDPERSESLNNLADHLITRYNRFKAIEDLNEAVVLASDALALRPQGHPERPTSLNNLADGLHTRYNHLGVIKDLNQAISLCRDALGLCPSGHPGRSRSLHNLACCLRTRFTLSNELSDKDEIFRLYAQLVDIPQMVSSIDLSAARGWINIAEDFQHPTALLAYETSLRLLMHYLATLPSLPQHLQLLRDLTSSLAVDAFSACIRDRSPSPAKAVELLEQGRGVFWGQLAHLRSPVDEVATSCPEGKMLADKFTQLTLQIRQALYSPGPNQHDRVCRLNVELKRVVSDIRRLTHFSRFLLPSLFSDLRKTASGGPVIIVNASKHGCDALIVLLDRDPIHVPLRITRDDVRGLSSALRRCIIRAKYMDVARELAKILRVIWDDVVSPIVDFLQTIHPLQSRIWWCPTAEFCLLPFHAAGPFRTGQRGLADLYIPSYTPSLNALIRARRHEASNSAAHGKRFVAIGQAKAKGESDLQSVGPELANIGRRVGGLTTFTRMEGPESCIPQVIEALGNNEWVHLACHGLPKPETTCELETAEFAYLSACHMTVGYEDGPDEMIHLASAMQFAGFRSVIGTMWAVDDRQTNKMTTVFYDNMIDESGRLDYTRAAFALDKTVKQVVGISFDQRILYIHLGA